MIQVQGTGYNRHANRTARREKYSKIQLFYSKYQVKLNLIYMNFIFDYDGDSDVGGGKVEEDNEAAGRIFRGGCWHSKHAGGAP